MPGMNTGFSIQLIDGLHIPVRSLTTQSSAIRDDGEISVAGYATEPC